MARLEKLIPVPAIVFVVPVSVMVPPPECVNEPGAIVEKLPATFKFVVAAAAIFEAPKLILLKLCVPVPESTAPGPLKLIVLVPPVNTPLFVKFPSIVCVKAPAEKVVPEFMVVLPLIEMFAFATNETAVPNPTEDTRFPATMNAVDGNVLITVPAEALKERLP